MLFHVCMTPPRLEKDAVNGEERIDPFTTCKFQPLLPLTKNNMNKYSMKILATIVLAMGASSVTAGKAGLTVSNKAVPSMTTYHEHMWSRLLEVSQQCSDATNALYATTELSTALEAYESEITQRAENGEICSTVGKCYLDSQTLSTHNALVSACKEVGGISYISSHSIYCTAEFRLSGDKGEISINYDNIPECLAAACNEMEVDEELDNIAATVVQIEEESLSFEYDNVQCSLGYGLEPKAALGMMSAMAALAWVIF